MDISRLPALALAAATLAACGATSTAGGSSHSATSGASARGSASAGSSGAASSTVHPTTGISRCRLGDVKVTWAAGGGAAGTDYAYIVVTNIGARPCLLEGFPAISYVSKSGALVGAAATHDLTNQPTLIHLASGERAAATYGAANALNYDPAQCKPATVPGIRVTLPGETASTTLAVPGEACANAVMSTLSVQAFTTNYRPASSSP